MRSINRDIWSEGPNFSAIYAGGTAMKITANTTYAGTATDTLELPLQGTNVTVDWGDGNIINYPTPGVESHTYASAVDENKLIEISSTTNTFTGLKYSFFDDNSNDRKKITGVSEWGSAPWPDMKNAFRSCSNLISLSATDTPNLDSVLDMTRAFQFCTGLTSFPTTWTLSGVQDFTRTWEGTTNMLTGFNNYDLSGATTLERTWYQYVDKVGLKSWNCTTSTALLDLRETWYKCDLSECIANIDIIDPSIYQWTLSGSGTNEYYLTRIDGLDPSGLTFDIANIVEDPLIMLCVDTPGALSPGCYAVGNNDTLGFNTVYVRLTDSADPSTKPGYYLTLRDTAVFPEFESSAVTDYAAPWVITNLRNLHPDISFAAATDIQGIIFGAGFMGLNKEIMGANFTFPEVTNALAACQSAANLILSVPPLMPKMTNGVDCFKGVGMIATDLYAAVLVNFRDVNPNNSVTYHAGTSLRNADAQDAYVVLIAAPRSWTITDGGMLEDYLLDEDGFTIRDEFGNPIILA